MKKTNSWIGTIKKNGSLKHFYFVYIAAFAVVALITLFSQLIIQNYLVKQSEDSFLINVAGKQRMLSQKITKSLLQYAVNPNDSILKQTIQTDLDYWIEKHELLKSENLIDSDYNTENVNEKI